ncbi:MAG: hypothetical protein PUC47_03670 [Oscillospiraceae bacterium]|nr:hypothetical protein [Oscillospiraceae bacterium]
MKKVCSIGLALALIVASVPMYSVSANDMEIPTVADQIVMQSLGVSSLAEDFSYELVPVTVSSTNGARSFSSEENDSAMVIVYTDTDDNGVHCTNTIYPFTETDDGDLVNTFSYAASSGTSLYGQFICDEITDLTLTLKTYYGLWVNYEDYIEVDYYKLYHSSAVWDKTNSSTAAYVTNFNLGVETRAEKYSTSFVDLGTIYEDSTYRQISSPVAGRTYSCAPLMTSTTSFLLRATSGMIGENHIGFGCLEFSYYNKNGALRNDELSIRVFGYD